MHVRVNRATHATEKRSRFFIACVKSHVRVNVALSITLLCWGYICLYNYSNSPATKVPKSKSLNEEALTHVDSCNTD